MSAFILLRQSRRQGPQLGTLGAAVLAQRQCQALPKELTMLPAQGRLEIWHGSLLRCQIGAGGPEAWFYLNHQGKGREVPGVGPPSSEAAELQEGHG